VLVDGGGRGSCSVGSHFVLCIEWGGRGMEWRRRVDAKKMS
jgi:hypothetical protein